MRSYVSSLFVICPCILCLLLLLHILPHILLLSPSSSSSSFSFFLSSLLLPLLNLRRYAIRHATMLIQAGRVQEGIEVAQRIVEHEDWNVQVNRFIEGIEVLCCGGVCVCVVVLRPSTASSTPITNTAFVSFLLCYLPSRPIIL